MKIDQALKTRLRKRLLQELRAPQDREVIVKSAYALKSSDLDLIKKSIKSLESAQLVSEIDPTILGGLVIIDGSKIIDFSVKGRISDIVDTLLAH